MVARAPISYPRGVQGLVSGMVSVPRGVGRMIRDPTLRKLAVLPILITGVLYLLAITLAVLYTPDVVGLVVSQPSEGFWSYAWYLLLPIAFALVLLLLGLLFITIASAVAGPFYEKMALEILRKTDIEARESGFVEGLASSLVRLLIFVVPSGVCLLLGPIPYIGPIFFCVGSVIGWMGLAAEANEPTLIATDHSLKERLSFLGRSFASVMGVGAAMGLSLLMPFGPLVFIPGAVVGCAELYARSSAGVQELNNEQAADAG